MVIPMVYIYIYHIFVEGNSWNTSINEYMTVCENDIVGIKLEVLYHIRPYFVGIFPYIGLIYGRYLQFRFLKWPLTEVPNNQTWLAVTWENPRTDLSGGFSSHGWFKSSSLGVDGDDLRVRIYRCAWCRLVWWWLIIDVLLRDVLMDGKYFTIFQFGKGKPSISMFFLWAIHLYHGLWCYEMVLTVCELEHGPLK